VKTITMMQLRAAPGEYAFRVRADGESFLVTYQGKPCFKMVPVEDSTVVRPDGTFKGSKPLTMGLRLGDEYAATEPGEAEAELPSTDGYCWCFGDSGMHASTHVPVGATEPHCDLCGWPIRPLAESP
jgi:antitoxin (DNA-binding transcriptional repressor) of toxin-antitoxin stability system